jgi:hypothetical protein
VSYPLPITGCHSPISPHHLPITAHLLTFFVQTNPILKIAEIDLTSVLKMGYAKTSPSAAPKTNPKRTQTNPKQTQSNPRFSPVIAPQSQNEPKRTQTKPTCSELCRTYLSRPTILAPAEKAGGSRRSLFGEDFRFGASEESFYVLAVAEDDHNGYCGCGDEEGPELRELPVGYKQDCQQEGEGKGRRSD